MTTEAEVKNGTDIKPFSVLKGQLKTAQRKLERTRVQIQNVLDAWREVSPEIPIASIEEAREMIADPGKFYRDAIINRDSERLKKFQSLLGSTFSLEKFAESAIQYPEKFSDVVNLSRLVPAEVKWDDYSFKDGQVSFGESFWNRQEGHTIFYARTAAQKKRLQYAQKLISTLKEMDNILHDDAEDLDIMHGKITYIFKRKVHVGPLPYPLRYETSYDENGLVLDIVPDEFFVMEGNRRVLSEHLLKKKK